MSLIADLRWFLDHLDCNDPIRIHRYGLWIDPSDGAGSMLGSPAEDPSFAAWLAVGEKATVVVRDSVPCFHVGRVEGSLCEMCAVYDEDGQAVVESSVRSITRTAYRWPMRAALARVHWVIVRPGRPRLSSTLVAVAAAGGDLGVAQEVLARSFPAIGDDVTALSHFAHAFHRVKDQWRETAPTRLLPRGERGVA